jgi:23S rRNA (cytidine1920-2'-O)/16S rRNA (cytidine1409-2'-O)-methyltransferase
LKKKRIDTLLFERKIVTSRNQAQNLIKIGKVKIFGERVIKSSELFDQNINIEVEKSETQWVSRGSIKLLHGLNYFKIDISNFTCLDIGASTGGFTEVLLSKGVKKVYCVDVGTNQLHEKLINNSKIINCPKINARNLSNNIIPELVDIIVCDVSFISMKKVIEPNLCFLKKKGIILGLIKPQFELENKKMLKKGIVLDKNIHNNVCTDYIDLFNIGFKMTVLGITPSPIKGQKGNIEFLICAQNKL